MNTPLNLHINGHTEESRKSPLDKTDDDDDDIDDDNLSDEEDDKSAGKLLFIFIGACVYKMWTGPKIKLTIQRCTPGSD